MPYAIVTISHSIVDGGHFFSWPHMRSSAIGICQLFLTGTNSPRRDSDFTHLLRRIVGFFHLHFVRGVAQTGKFRCFFVFVRAVDKTFPAEQHHHLPDLTSFDDTTNLLFLLNIVILGHLLHRPFYEDQLCISRKMYEAWAHGREQAADILDHISTHYYFYMEGREVDFSFLVYSFLSHQIRCLVRKAKAAAAVRDSGAQLYDGLMHAIPFAFANSHWLSTMLATHRRINRSTDLFDWYDKSQYVISVREAGHTMAGA
jgi:hypothetical protein